MKHVHPSRLLKAALAADAVVSAAVALLQIVAAGALAEWLALPRGLLFETGLFLVGYTLLLVVLARSARVPAWLVGFIVVGNVGWAIGCVALPAAGWVTPNAAGMAYLALQAVAVLAFAVLEFAGLRVSAPAGHAGTAAAR